MKIVNESIWINDIGPFEDKHLRIIGENKMDVFCIIIGIIIMIALIIGERDYIKKYELYANIVVVYVITVAILYLIGNTISNRIGRSEFLR